MDRSTAHASREDTAVPLSIVWSSGALELNDAVNIGANPANHVALEDRFVSGFHCRVFPATGRWRVKDLGSTNGTYVDGLRVGEAELDAGSRLKVGTHELRIEDVTPRRAPSLPGVVARDPALTPVLAMLERAAPSMLPVMILGESGTGKEVAARAVHELSPRAQGPFVPLNCGAISRELAEAELFGHEKGAFTGAIASAPGAFGAADGGTLFLDEIGDLPLSLQVKLLRALEAGEIKPVGSPRPRAIDVRVVCATHQDLRAKVADGSFREDLFYRLRGVTVELPPLRARPQDILPLADHFLPPRCTLAADARAALLTHRWPGNVRELRHVIQLGVLLSDSPIIRAGALHFEGRPTYLPIVADREIADDGAIELRGRTLGELEEIAIRGSLKRHEGNRHAVAAELGIARSTLLRKLDQLGLRE